MGTIGLADWKLVLVPALTLSALLSIDTLKTCVIVDTLTRARHDSNRTLRGQGIGNVASALTGGMPGSGMMGATIVSLNSGEPDQASPGCSRAALCCWRLCCSAIWWAGFRWRRWPGC